MFKHSGDFLTEQQRAISEAPADELLFLEGSAGCGKTTAAVERMLHLMAHGVPGNSILVVVPQRALAEPYEHALKTPGVVAGGMVATLTIGGLARRMVELFWPLISTEAGFHHPERPPVFLTLETAQYYMAHLVRPLLDQGYFETVVMDRNRLYSQIIDNLNKAALVGFPHTEIGERLRSAWVGDPVQARIYADAQECANRFREFCLQHNLLDFSLQLELFLEQLWPSPLCREYLLDSYQHLIVDNLEENPAVFHDLLQEWLPHCLSALLVYDQQAGFRRFLGADPQGARRLEPLCSRRFTFERSFVAPEYLLNFGENLEGVLRPDNASETPPPGLSGADIERALNYTSETHRYYPEMLDWVSDQVEHLVREQGLPPGEIAILSPFLSDALRFSLIDRLNNRQIPVRTHRPSRSLREESATQCLLTLAALAHPEWNLLPTRFDFAYALLEAIQDMDLVRAQILAEIVYRYRDGMPDLSTFEQIKPEVQERITYQFGARYERMRLWLQEYINGPRAELDHFLSRLFGEVLSQPGFGFHASYTAGEITANLVESVQKFRWVVETPLQADGTPLGKEYLQTLQEGVLAATYYRSWQQPEDAVFLAPAYTFLMQNRPVDVQFWLDIGSRSWSERIEQPLTHPYVLSRNWPAGAVWTQVQEQQTSEDALYRLMVNLVLRCRRRVYLGISQLNEHGYENRGALLRAIDRLLTEASRPT